MKNNSQLVTTFSSQSLYLHATVWALHLVWLFCLYTVCQICPWYLIFLTQVHYFCQLFVVWIKQQTNKFFSGWTCAAPLTAGPLRYNCLAFCGGSTTPHRPSMHTNYHSSFSQTRNGMFSNFNNSYGNLLLLYTPNSATNAHTHTHSYLHTHKYRPVSYTHLTLPTRRWV